MVDTFVKMFAPMGEIVEKKGTSCRRLFQNAFARGGQALFNDLYPKYTLPPFL